MEDKTPEAKAAPVERLCSEIQLFDLCERETCRHKKGRYCSDAEMLAKFEAIQEEDERNNLVYEVEEGDEDDDLEYDEFEGDDYEDDE